MQWKLVNSSSDADDGNTGKQKTNIDLVDGVAEEFGWRRVEDGAEGALNDGAGTARHLLRQARQSVADLLREDAVAVVDRDPAHPPARHQVPAHQPRRQWVPPCGSYLGPSPMDLSVLSHQRAERFTFTSFVARKWSTYPFK